MRSRWLVTITVFALMCGVAGRADARQSADREVNVMPLYFWATALDGNLTAGSRTVPVFLKFIDAADNLGGAFTFRFDASRGRWGVLSDLNFLRLSSSAAFTVLGRRIEGDFDLDNLVFEVAGSYLVSERGRIAIIGGLRTYRVAPYVTFRTPNAGATPIDTSETSANAFAGLTFRPRLSDRWSFLGRADIGGGNADLTWSAAVGFQYRVSSWGALEFGFRGLGIDVSRDDGDPRLLTEYQATHYGPLVGFGFHWGR